VAAAAAGRLLLLLLVMVWLVSTPCIMSLWLTTSMGTTTACVDREAAPPARKLLVAARVAGARFSCSPTLVMPLLVTSRVVRYTTRAEGVGVREEGGTTKGQGGSGAAVFHTRTAPLVCTVQPQLQPSSRASTAPSYPPLQGLSCLSSH
jgi:hypothetical protein